METNEKNTNVKAKLHSALTNIQLELGALKKDGKVEFGGGYDYISYENLNSELKVLLHKHGISIIPDMESCEINRLEKKNSCLLKLNIIVTDTETGYSETFKTFAYAEDNGDKVVGKAFTEALKRWEFKTFHVTSKDSKLFDIDYYQQDNETHEKPTITRKEEPKQDIKPEPKQEVKQPKQQQPKQENDDAEPKINLRAALTTLTVNGETDTACILAALKAKGFKTAADVPENMHQTILNISKELYKEFLKSEQYKKEQKNEKN